MGRLTSRSGFTLLEMIMIGIALALLIALGLSLLGGGGSSAPPAGTATVTPGTGTGLPSGFMQAWATTEDNVGVGETSTFVYQYTQYQAISGNTVPVENETIVFAVVGSNVQIVSINGTAVNAAGAAGRTVAAGTPAFPGQTSPPAAGTITVVITATGPNPDRGTILAIPAAHLGAPIHHAFEVYVP